jgi:hypothetical protein
MSDFTAGQGGGHHAHRTPKAEFRVYFALIFLLALPVGLATWIYRIATTGRLPATGPIGRAWADARAITPSIFRA